MITVNILHGGPSDCCGHIGHIAEIENDDEKDPMWLHICKNCLKDIVKRVEKEEKEDRLRI